MSEIEQLKARISQLEKIILEMLEKNFQCSGDEPLWNNLSIETRNAYFNDLYLKGVEK